jgi:hypothetical protein
MVMRSADAGEQLAAQHVDGAREPQYATAGNLSGRTGIDAADHDSATRDCVLPENLDRPLGVLAGEKGDKTALIRHMERVEAEQFASRPDVVADRNGLFLQPDREARGARPA